MFAGVGDELAKTTSNKKASQLYITRPHSDLTTSLVADVTYREAQFLKTSDSLRAARADAVNAYHAYTAAEALVREVRAAIDCNQAHLTARQIALKGQRGFTQLKFKD